MIRKNPNGTYTARLGRGPQHTFPFRREAEEYLDTQRENKRRAKAGLPVEQKPITYGELCHLWRSNYQPSPWRQGMLDYSVARWKDVLLTDIKPQALGAWLHTLKGNKGDALSGKTKAHILETMRQVLNAGVEWEYLRKSPARPGAFKAPSQQRSRPINPFESWAEVEAVAKAIGHTGPLVRFVCATGLTSPSEWLRMTWADVDLKNKELRVHGTKTKNRPRTIPLGEQAIAALNELPRSLSGAVFLSKRGRPFSQHLYHEWRANDWAEALEAAGLSHRTPNEMRHTFATLALSAGVPIDDVSTMLGHGDVAITFRFYRKWIRPMADRARLILDTIGKEKADIEERANT